MKKYMKQLALSVLTLCMIFTLATGNVVNAENIGINVGDQIKISYVGRDITNPNMNQVVNTTGKNSKGEPLTMLAGDKGALINPTANVDWFQLKNNLAENRSEHFFLTNEGKKPTSNNDSDKFFTDDLGNAYFDHLKDKSQYVKSGDKYDFTSEFVGWKAMQKSEYERIITKTSTMYNYIDNFVYQTRAEAEKNVTFKDGYITLEQWNKAVNSTGQTNPNELFLVAVHVIKQEPKPLNVKPGDDVGIHYVGVNLNYWGKVTETDTALGFKNLEGKRIALPTDSKVDGLLINPTANISDTWELSNRNKEVIYDSDYTQPQPDRFFDTNKYFVDEYGQKNTYYGYVTEQTIDGVVYQLVGWRIVGSSTIEPGLSGKKYIEKYSNYQTFEEAKPHITFKHNQMIGYDEWEKAVRERNDYYLNDGDDETNPGPDNEINLLGVYIPKPEEPIDFGSGKYEYDGTSKWNVKAKQLDETSKDIDTEVYVNDDGENIIRFTIPEGYDEDSIQLTLDDELVKLFAFHFGSAGADIEENDKSVTYAEEGEYEPHKQKVPKPGTIKDKEYYDILPGDVRNFKIEVVNNSDNLYGYQDNSLIIKTPNLDFYRNSEEYTEYRENALDYNGATMKAFDGQTLLNKFTPTRIKNEALYSLFGDETASVIVNDKTLGDKLNTLFTKNPQGIGNLNKYYLDFYNREFSKNNSNFVPKTKLEDFENSQIKDMFFDKEHSSMKRETNKEVAETLYNYFYNVVLGVAPADYLPEPESKALGDSVLEEEFTVGNFMRNGNTNFDQYMRRELGRISTNTNDSFVEWGFQIDGPHCFNIYNNMDYGFDMGFKLEKKVGDVTVEKHIELDDFDKNNTPTFMFKLTDSKGVEYFKTISFNEDENDKKVVFKDIPYGKYTVEEIDPIRYEVLGQPILEGELDEIKTSGYIQYVNTKVKDNDFSDTNLIINSFKKGDNGIEISKNEHNNGKRR